MFCPNCGAKAEGGKFCTSCGSALPIVPESALIEAPQTEQPVNAYYYGQPAYPGDPYQAPQTAEAPVEPKGGKKKMKPWLWAVIGVGAALLLAGLVFLDIFLFARKDPTAQVAAAAVKSMEAVKKTEAGTFTDELEKSEIKLRVDLKKAVGSIPVNAEAEVTMSQDLEAGKMSLFLSVLVKGKEIADLGVYMDDKDLAVTSDTLLGKDAYGLTFETLPKDLKKSIFAPGSGSDYELPEDVYNILSQLDQSPYALYKEGRGALKELAEDGGKKLLESLRKHAEVSNEEGKLSVGKSSVDCKVIKCEADEEATKAIVEDMVAWLQEEKTREKLERFFSVYAKIMNIAEGEESADAKDLLDDFYKEMDRSVEEMDDSESELYFYISKDNGQLLGFQAEYEGEKDEGSVRVAAGPDFESPEEIRIEIETNGEKQFITYEVTENTDKNYTATLTVDDGYDEEEYEFAWKKSRGGFTISENDYKLVEGTLKIDEDSLLVKIDDIGLSLEVTKGAETENVPKFTNIVQMDEDEFDDLVQDLFQEIQNLVYSFL